MNKDAWLATIIGFGVGLLIAAGVFLAPSIFTSLPKFRFPDLTSLLKKFEKTTKTIPTPTPKPSDKLTIQSPLADSIEPKNETLVTGTSIPESIIVIEGESTETVVVANTQGAFAGKIALGEGKNDILVTSYAKESAQTQTVRVYYTPEDF